MVDAFIRGLGMPRSLADVNVTNDQLERIAEFTMLDFWSRTNPRHIDGPHDVMTILEMVKA